MLDKTKTDIIDSMRIGHPHPRISVTMEGIVAKESLGKCDGHHMTFDFRTNGRGGAQLNGAELQRQTCCDFAAVHGTNGM